MAEAFSVELRDGETSFHCREDEHLLGAMIRSGKTAIKVGCRNGGCGVCRIHIRQGAYRCGKMSRSRISEADEEQGIVLACRVFPLEALQVEALPLPVKKPGVM